MGNNNELLKFLISEFDRRKRVNSKYSLRAFSKQIGLPAGRTSEILNQKRPISKKLAVKLKSYFGLENMDFSNYPRPGEKLLSVDKFAIVSDWYHFAILSLLDTKGFKSDSGWIASRLGIQRDTVENALKRLEGINLISRKGGKIQKSQVGTATVTDVPSAALRASHQESIYQAAEALNKVPVELRDVTSITMAVNTTKLPAAKKAIAVFRKKMAALLEDAQATEVYNLNIQLVPLTKEIE